MLMSERKIGGEPQMLFENFAIVATLQSQNFDKNNSVIQD